MPIFNRVSTRRLIIASVTVIAIVVLVVWYAQTKQSAETATAPYSTDPFTLGQYYFNHDEDPAGPYDLDKAYGYYTETLLASSTENPLAWYQRGRISFIRGDFDDALYDFKKQQQYFDDQVPNVHYMFGLTYGYRARDTESEEDWRLAAEGFKTFLDYRPESPWAATDLSWIYFAQGRYEEMLPVLETALETNHENPWVHNMYGLALLNLDEKKRAQGHFLLAKQYAAELTTREWGTSYPGNSPAEWEVGLASFREAIDKNLALASE